MKPPTIYHITHEVRRRAHAEIRKALGGISAFEMREVRKYFNIASRVRFSIVTEIAEGLGDP
jgi:hypothetical protein